MVLIKRIEGFRCNDVARPLAVVRMVASSQPLSIQNWISDLRTRRIRASESVDIQSQRISRTFRLYR